MNTNNMMKPNMNKKDPSGIVYLDLINTKFKDYNKEYRRNNDAFIYLMNMWRELDYDCDFWVFLLEHYKYHIHNHKNYHKIREHRALNKIKRIMMNKIYLVKHKNKLENVFIELFDNNEWWKNLKDDNKLLINFWWCD